MASLQNQDELDPNAAPQATDTTTTAGTPDTGGATSQNSSPVNAQTANQQDVSQITGLNQNVDFSPLLDYVKGQGTSARNAVGTANTDFTNSLGSWTPFGQNEQNTLTSVIQGNTPLQTGSDLMNKQYTGPQNVNYQMYNPLIDKYTTSAGETQNSAGINTLLQQMQPQMTPGERSYDALVYGQNPNYMQQSRGMVNDAGDVAKYGQDTATNATNAVKQRQGDISAFNQAANTFVGGQRDSINSAIRNQMTGAATQDKAIQDEMGQLAGGTSFDKYDRSTYNFDPNQYAPQTFSVDPHAYASYDAAAGQPTYAPGSFNQTVSPGQYLAYNQGQAATRENMATQDQANQYNNIEQLLNLTDRLRLGAPRQAATLGLNNQALSQALAQAQAQRDAVANQDAAWLAAQGRTAGGGYTPYAPENTGTEQGGDAGMGGGTNGGQSSGADMGGSADASADSGSGDAGSGDGGSGDDGFAKGGLVGRKPSKSPLEALKGAPTPPVQPQQMPLAQPGMIGQPATLGQPAVGMTRGGYLPPGTGAPGRDTIPAHLNNGEFVTRAPVVKGIGSQNMNMMNRLPTGKDAAVRNALHHALSRAMR